MRFDNGTRLLHCPSHKVVRTLHLGSRAPTQGPKSDPPHRGLLQSINSIVQYQIISLSFNVHAGRTKPLHEDIDPTNVSRFFLASWPLACQTNHVAVLVACRYTAGPDLTAARAGTFACTTLLALFLALRSIPRLRALTFTSPIWRWLRWSRYHLLPLRLRRRLQSRCPL